MIDSSAANRLVAISFFFATALAVAFAFFSLTGGFRTIGLPGASIRYDDEALERPRPRQPAPPKPIVQRAPELRAEPFRPVTHPEMALQAAIDKYDTRKARIDARREESRLFAEFLATERGEQLSRALSLARESRFDEARSAIEEVLADMADLDVTVRMHVLKSAFQVFAASGDKEGFRGLLERYLKTVEEDLARPDLDQRQKASAHEMFDRVQDALLELEAGG